MNQWLVEHVKPVLDSILYAVLGTIILVGGFRILIRSLPFSLRKEIEEDHNIALAILVSAFVLGISIIIAAAIN